MLVLLGVKGGKAAHGSQRLEHVSSLRFAARLARRLRGPMALLPPTLILALAAPALALAAETTPTVAERAAGLERHDGFVPFYWDARRGQLLFELSRFGEELLYGAGLAGGAGLLEVPLDRGALGDLGLVRFERVGARVLLHQRQTTHRSGVS